MMGTLHAFEYWLMNYRRTWYGSVFSSFLIPVLFRRPLDLQQRFFAHPEGCSRAARRTCRYS